MNALGAILSQGRFRRASANPRKTTAAKAIKATPANGRKATNWFSRAMKRCAAGFSRSTTSVVSTTSFSIATTPATRPAIVFRRVAVSPSSVVPRKVTMPEDTVTVTSSYPSSSAKIPRIRFAMAASCVALSSTDIVPSGWIVVCADETPDKTTNNKTHKKRI